MKKLINNIKAPITLLLFFLSSFIYSQTLEDSLLIHYKFDGNSLDYSGNDNNPEIFRASFSEDNDGNQNSAVYFNGIDDLIILPNKPELKPQFPLTISFWIKMDTLIPQNNVFFTNDFYRYAHSGVWLNLSSSNRLALSYGDGVSFSHNSRFTKQSDIELNSNTWYFITGVIWSPYDLRIYINGIEEPGYYEGGAYYFRYVGTGGNIGRKDANDQTSPFFYKGYLDDFRYWNRGLSDSEISKLYYLTVNVDKSSCIETSIYPNPASKVLRLKLDIKEDEFTIIVRNIVGKLCLMTKNKLEIDVSKLKNGIYIIEVSNNNQTLLQTKFIKTTL